MVHIIKGDRDSGKTMTIRALYQNLRRGDGIISEKSFRGSVCVGYDLVHLSADTRQPLALQRHMLPPRWNESDTWGKFSFSQDAFLCADTIMETILKKGTGPLFIDEIGPLELNGRGFHNILRRTLASGREMYVTARSHLVHRILTCFGIGDYRIMDATVPGDGRN